MLSINWLDFIGLFGLLGGIVIGLGAVTVIDLHGFLGRRSAYWTEATTRTHKVTKPLIWLGIFLAVVGGSIFFRGASGPVPLVLGLIAGVLILNGLFLSFRVSPYLLARERAGRASELLPAHWQRQIALGLIVSDLGWWGGLAIIVWHLVGGN